MSVKNEYLEQPGFKVDFGIAFYGPPHLREDRMLLLFKEAMEWERAQCAKIAAGMAWVGDPNDDMQERYNDACDEVSKAIIKRGELS